MIELIHLRKEFEGVTPLADVNAVIRDGDIISVIGPSGTGEGVTESVSVSGSAVGAGVFVGAAVWDFFF